MLPAASLQVFHGLYLSKQAKHTHRLQDSNKDQPQRTWSSLTTTTMHREVPLQKASS